MNGVGPGAFILFDMSTVHIQRATTAAIDPQTRSIRSAAVWPDGTHNVGYWQPGMDEPEIRNVFVKDNTVLNTDMGGALMALRKKDDCASFDDDINNPNMNTYQVESINLTEDGLVDVVCTFYPCDVDGIPDLYYALFGLGKYKRLYDPDRCWTPPKN